MLHPAQLTHQVLHKSPGACPRQAASPVPTRAHCIPLHHRRMGAAGITACSCPVPHELPRPLLITNCRAHVAAPAEHRGSCQSRARAGPRMGLMQEQLARLGLGLARLAVLCHGSYRLCSAGQGGWRRQSQHHRVAQGSYICTQSFPASAPNLPLFPAAIRP